MNVSPSAISGWETDVRQPSYEDLKRLAQLFDVTADYFLFPSKSMFLPKKDEDFYMSVLFAPFPSADEKHTVRRVLFIVSVFMTYGVNFTGSPYMLVATFFLWLSYLAVRTVQMFTPQDSLRTIHYKNNDRLYFEIDWSPKKILIARIENLVFLTLNMAFGITTILFTQTFFQKYIEETHGDFIYLSFVFLFALYIYLFAMEFTHAKMRKVISFFQAGEQFYIARFYIAASMNGFFFVFVSWVISISRPYDDPMPLLAILATLSLANFMLSALLLHMNKRNAAQYELYLADADGSRKTKIG
jgi:hypothetical protein